MNVDLWACVMSNYPFINVDLCARQLVGFLMIVTFFVILFTYMAWIVGWRYVLGMILITIACLGWLLYASYLISGSL